MPTCLIWNWTRKELPPGGDDPEPVVQGPPNYNIFHGESPPRLIETKEEALASGAAPSAPESTSSVAAKKEEQSEDPVLTVDTGIGEVDYTADDQELPEAEDPTAPTEGAALSAPAEAAVEEGADFQQVRRRGTRGRKDAKKKEFKRQYLQVGLPSA